MTYIENVPYFTQRDNADSPSNTCLPTSMSMAVQYILNMSGLSKSDIGCPENQQVEDYITGLSRDETTTQQMLKKQSVWGRWIWNYNKKRWLMLYIAEFLFNRLMGQYGFSAQTDWSISFERMSRSIDRGFPVVILGNFSSISRVSGHYNTAIGYNGAEVITHDPYGDALSGYALNNGEFRQYSWDFFNRKNGNSYGLIFIEK